jgi:putative transposase
MFRSYKFLLQPTKGQSRRLEALLGAQRELYNAALEERRGAWRLEGRSVTRFEQFGQLSDLWACRPDVMAYGVCVARGTLTRLDHAFAGFFRRCRAGERPGFPRFKGAGRWDSVRWPDAAGWKLNEANRRFYAQGVGHIRVRLHRSVQGTPKTAVLRREWRRWFCVIQCADVPASPRPATGRVVGLDLGVANLASTSDGEHVPNPRHLARAHERLATAQQALARKQRGSRRRRRAVERVAAQHRKVANCRRDHHHRLSRRLVDTYDVIVHEHLAIPNMVRSARGTLACPGTNVAAKRGLNRSIFDAGWGQLLRFVSSSLQRKTLVER